MRIAIAAILVVSEGCPSLVTLHDILERTRASGQKLSPGEALWLFAAVTREAAEKKATVRARLVQIDPNGSLQLTRFDDKRCLMMFGRALGHGRGRSHCGSGTKCNSERGAQWLYDRVSPDTRSSIGIEAWP